MTLKRKAKAIVNLALKLKGLKVKNQNPKKYKRALSLVESTLKMIEIYDRKHKGS